MLENLLSCWKHLGWNPVSFSGWTRLVESNAIQSNVSMRRWAGFYARTLVEGMQFKASTHPIYPQVGQVFGESCSPKFSFQLLQSSPEGNQVLCCSWIGLGDEHSIDDGHV